MKRTAMDRPIHVYTCVNDPEQKCIALIEGISMIFRGDTPMKARKVADAFRRDAIANDKLLTRARKAELLGQGAP